MKIFERNYRYGLLIILLLLGGCGPTRVVRLQGYTVSPHWQEQIKEFTYQPDVRVHINAPSEQSFDSSKPTLLLLYALPNGNSIEWTIGRAKAEGLDWHYYIQHIGAQTRRLREVIDEYNIVVAYLEAKQKSWPTWRRQNENSSELIVQLIAHVRDQVGVADASIVLTGHSGGGSFTFGYLDGVESIPDTIKRISFLDSNYSFTSEAGHATKLLDWIKRSPEHYLTVLAYDDREITFDGKKVVGPTGGTFRATGRMLESFQKEIELTTTDVGDYIRYKGLGGRMDIIVHKNPDNKILHTALVGDMNGFIHSMTAGTRYEGQAAVFNGPLAYEKWIQPF